MHIGQPSHGAPVGLSTGGHLAREFRDIRLLAVTTATGWTRPRAGFAPIASWRSFSTIAKQVISARSGDRDDREVRDGENIWKCPRWSALYSAWHWHSSWEPRLVLRAKESNNQKVWRGIKQSKSHKYHYPIPLVFRIKTIKNPGKSREIDNTGRRATS